MTQQEALQKIAEKRAQVDQLLEECQEIAQEAGIEFQYDAEKYTVWEASSSRWNDSSCYVDEESWNSSGSNC